MKVDVKKWIWENHYPICNCHDVYKVKSHVKDEFLLWCEIVTCNFSEI